MVHALLFDSGVGGLSVAAEIRRLLPDLQMTYVADDEYRPYGDKTDQQLQKRLPGLLWTLVETVKPDLVVIACNTASTSALPNIRGALDIPVVGVVPAIKPAALMSKARSFAVLGTPGTVRRKYVDQLVEDFAPDHQIKKLGSTQLVLMAEDKLSGGKVNISALQQELSPIFAGPKIDTIVLACTHFPLLKTEIAKAAPYPVTLIDSGEAIARRVKNIVESLTSIRPKRLGGDLAFLIGPPANRQRRLTFDIYGFERVIGLMPE